MYEASMVPHDIRMRPLSQNAVESFSLAFEVYFGVATPVSLQRIGFSSMIA